MNKNSSNLPIGVFDSGIGGVTVLKSLIESFPHEKFIYLGDTARLPYGSKSPSKIYNYSEQNIKFLYHQGVKAIVIACNSASSHFTNSFYKEIPIYGVVKPSAYYAVNSTKNNKIGILGTKATVTSQSYVDAIQSVDSKTNHIFQQACPLFVPLAEEGMADDIVTEIIAKRYLESMLKENVDTIILGCTHYPILKPTLKKVGNSVVNWIDTGQSIAKLLISEFNNNKILKNTESNFDKKIKILTTDESQSFKDLASKILARNNLDFQLVNLSF